MRTSMFNLALITTALLYACTALADQDPLENFQLDLSNSVTTPRVGSEQFMLIDASSHTILAAKKAYTRSQPASLTKLLTLYIIESLLEQNILHNEDKVFISPKARNMEGSRMFLEADTHETVDLLVQGLIVTSGNDATIALAEHISGSEEKFVELMNQKAKQLGMLNSHFANATGLPNQDHYSTAYDLGLLAYRFVQDHPKSLTKLSQKWLTYNDIKQHNRNTLLWQNSDVYGMKTGHTQDAGYCLITASHQKGHHIISVVLGDKTEQARNQSTNILLQHATRGFEHFSYQHDKDIKTSKIWYGEQDKTQAMLAESAHITIPIHSDKIVKKITVTQNVFAPLQAGEIVGEYEISYDDTTLFKTPLIINEDLKASGSFQMFSDWLAYHAQALYSTFINP